MRIHTVVRLLALNLGIAVANIALFSPGILHLDMSSGNALSLAFGVAFLVASGLLLVWGNYRLIFASVPRLRAAELVSIEDCEIALRELAGRGTVGDDAQAILGQIERFGKKRASILDMLGQRFSSTELSYTKFAGVIAQVEQVFTLNIKSILNKIAAFDDDDYRALTAGHAPARYSPAFAQSKLAVYNGVITFERDAVGDDEEILLRLDKNLLELSKLGSIEAGELENLSAIREMDELISQAKWYK